MITLHYFASIREAAGRSSESLALPREVSNVQGLIRFLASREPSMQAMLNDEKGVLVAVNQTVVDRSFQLAGDEEVALFPPMTGG